MAILAWLVAPFFQIAAGGTLAWMLRPRRGGWPARQWLLVAATLLASAVPLTLRALALLGEPGMVDGLYEPGWGTGWACTAADIALPLVGTALCAGLVALRRPWALALGVWTFILGLAGIGSLAETLGRLP